MKTKHGKKTMSNAAMINAVVAGSGADKKTVTTVLDSLVKTISNEVTGNGTVMLFGLLKIKVVDKKERAAREAIDPFTKQLRQYPAKPAGKAVKVHPLKGL